MATTRMPVEKFLPLYLKAHEDGLSKEEFARKLGVKPSTVYQRVYELRHPADGSSGLDIPALRSESRVSKFAKAREILEAYQGGKAAAPAPKKKAAPAKVAVEDKAVAEEPSLVDEADELTALLGSGK